MRVSSGARRPAEVSGASGELGEPAHNGPKMFGRYKLLDQLGTAHQLLSANQADLANQRSQVAALLLQQQAVEADLERNKKTQQAAMALAATFAGMGFGKSRSPRRPCAAKESLDDLRRTRALHAQELQPIHG